MSLSCWKDFVSYTDLRIGLYLFPCKGRIMSLNLRVGNRTFLSFYLPAQPLSRLPEPVDGEETPVPSPEPVSTETKKTGLVVIMIKINHSLALSLFRYFPYFINILNLHGWAGPVTLLVPKSSAHSRGAFRDFQSHPIPSPT